MQLIVNFSHNYPPYVTGGGTLLHDFSLYYKVLRVARNGGQALVTPLDRFLCRVRVCRGVTMLRPRQDASRTVDQACNCGEGSMLCCKAKGRSNVTWFRPPVTRANAQGTVSACPPRPATEAAGGEKTKTH